MELNGTLILNIFFKFWCSYTLSIML